MKNQLQESFIIKAKNVHKDFYEYSLVKYKNVHTPVEIICKQHGAFFQRPNNHLHGMGCPQCKKDKISKKNSLGQEQFLLHAQNVHANIYDYTKVRYINNIIPVEIICRGHGPFFQRPAVHLRGGGCRQCSNERKRKKIGRYCSEYFKGNPNKKDTPATLYLVSLTKGREKLLKVGITITTVERRFQAPKTFHGYRYNVLASFKTTLFDAYTQEQALKKQFASMSKHPINRFNGYTECLEWSSTLERVLAQKIGVIG